MGDLYGYIERFYQSNVHSSRKTFNPLFAKSFFKDIVQGVRYMHSIGYCNRDVSPENCLIFFENNRLMIKLTDFGLSSKNSWLDPSNPSSRKGKSFYTAPEVFGTELYEACKTDIWSLGCLFFVLKTGFPIMENAESGSIAINFLKSRGVKELIKNYQVLDRFSDQEINLIEGMLQVSPNKRLDIQGVSDHPYFT